MRIWLSGSHGSGKSTLARYCSKQYNLPLTTETARMILSEQELQIDSLRYDLDVADKYQRQVFDRQILEEQKYDSFVSDRSIIDILAYSAQHSRILSSLMDDSRLKERLSILNNPDSIYFFVRPCQATLKADGIRESLNWDGVIAIDAMIKLLLQMFNLKHFCIYTDNMQERIQFIDSILSKKTPY